MYESRHLYATIIGDAYGGLERWQFGFRLLNITVPSQTSQQAALLLAPVVEAWWKGTGYAPNQLTVDPTHRLTELKVADVGQDGKYPVGVTSYSHFYLPALTGAAAFVSGSTPQDALCITLTTGKPRGYASKGRIYMPPVANFGVQVDGLLTTGTALTFANNFKKFITDINAIPELGPVSVMSRGKGEKVLNAARKRYDWTYPGVGYSQAVTGVRVGRVVDTQRRRRRSLVENPQAVQLV